MTHEQALGMLRQHRLVAILRGVPMVDTLNVVEALVNGGVRVLEFTYDHDLPDCLGRNSAQVSLVRREYGDGLLVGCGTVLTEAEVRAGHDAGAQLIVSPNVDRDVIARTRALEMLSMPGALSPTEIVQAHQAGADVVKLFPAGALGLGYIRAIRAPLKHIPMAAVGGVKPENVAEFLDAGVCGFGVGSEMVQKDALANRDFAAITARVREFTGAIARWEAER